MPTLKVNEIISYSGNNLSLGTSGDTVTVPANVTFNALGANVYIPSAIAKLDGITTSNTSTYNLTYGGSPYSPASATACLVSLNGIIQAPTTAFTISANTISFSTALTSTDVIDFITVLAAPYTLNVPGDGTVGITKLSATGTPSSSTYLRGDNTWSAVASPIVWNQTVQSTNFTASVNVGYMVNTTTAAVTVTLPASPSIGDQIQFVDFNETAATNNIILDPNGLKIDGVAATSNITKGGEGVTIMYSGTTRGWIPVSAANEGTAALASQFSLDFLVVAGGGGGGTLGGGGGAGGYRTSTQSVTQGTVITVTVGDGGAGSTGNINTGSAVNGSSGSNSSISGSGLTTITSAGGGYGGGYNSAELGTGGAGGSGGGNKSEGFTAGGSGNTPSTSPSQGNNGGSGNGSAPNYGAGGGGGASAVGNNGTNTTGGNGGAGTASSITGSSVTRAGGGGGGTNTGGTAGSGGTGGGGNGTTNESTASSGTVNTGSGGGGGGYTNPPGNGGKGGAGGKGVVIISLATIHYSGTSSGSPTVTTSGSNTILQFNGSGTYTV